MNDTKPGYLSTEFWITLLTGALAMAALFMKGVDTEKLGAVVQAAALIAASIASWGYSHSRAKVKAGAPSTTVAAGQDVTVETP